MPNSPMETAKWTPDVPNGSGSRADGSSVCRHAYCVGNETETAGNEAEHVRTRRNEPRTRNSPNGHDIATPKPTIQWKKVSAGGIDVYVPQNAPIEAASRIFVFGRPESRDEAIAPSLEGERAGHGDGDGNGGDGEGDTTSGGDVDSKRVDTALLAGDSQLECQSRRIRTGNLPVSSGPPIRPTERLYGHVRR